jgi:methylthioribose-1-phosphate isomerase
MADMTGTARSIHDIDTVALEGTEDAPELVIIDQTLLPGEVALERLSTREEAWRAIKRLEVRGAPAIGVSAAIASYVDAARAHAGLVEGLSAPADAPAMLARVAETCDYLGGARPTAVNLTWALARMRRAAEAEAAQLEAIGVSGAEAAAAIVARLREEAEAIRDEDVRVCHAIGEAGVELVREGDGIVTHCNAGKLCAVRYGTATAPIYVAHERGMNVHVTCDETRPLLQGARLTAFELMAAGIETCVECDDMSASRIREGAVQLAFVGCDRVAANGDVANKIGTSMLALACERYGVPFYVCAPTSTIDLSCKTGADIVIEQRAAEEVTEMWYAQRMAPEGVDVYNPAFDVTDADLVSGIVTEYGIARPPYDAGLAEIFRRKAEAEAEAAVAPHRAAATEEGSR